MLFRSKKVPEPEMAVNIQEDVPKLRLQEIQMVMHIRSACP